MLRKLANGFTVIAEKPDDGRGQMSGTIVLAFSGERGRNEYATWWHRNSDGATFDGDYFPLMAYSGSQEQFEKASQAFIDRKGL
jgi:hypothetical protein